MRKFVGRLFALALVSAAAVPVQAGDAAAGEQRARVCASCHGPAGISRVPAYPSLAGLDQDYLIAAMNAYRNNERRGGMANIMRAQMSGLTEQDIANLAAYYASLPSPGAP